MNLAARSSPADSHRGKAYLQLLRIPNIFTAMADIAMGFLFTHRQLAPWPEFALLLGASCLIYSAGMVLNDVFDCDVDALERPHRPIPSGRIAKSVATRLGYLLLFTGMALGWLTSLVTGSPSSAVVASLLGLAVVLYDRTLKRTPLAPIAMGLCRFLNVLLGMSSARPPWPGHPIYWWVASGVGIYIVGVTWFARTEARTSNRRNLCLALAIMLGGIAILAWYPFVWPDSTPKLSIALHALSMGDGWMLLWAVLGISIFWRCLRAIFDPSPRMVQVAIKQCILSLIMLDAITCAGLRGLESGAAIALLLIPTFLVGRWIYST